MITSDSDKKDITLSERIDQSFQPVVDWLNVVLFWDPFAAMGLHDPIIYDEQGNPMLDEAGQPLTTRIPFIVMWLIFGALIFTVVMSVC